jgi:hypothetical protein
MPDPTPSDVHIPSASTGVLGIAPPANVPVPQPPMALHRGGKWYVSWRGKEYGPFSTHTDALDAAWSKLGMKISAKPVQKSQVQKSADLSGSMVAFRPPFPVCEALFELGNEDINQLHITVVYIGDENSLPDKDKLYQVVGEFARTHTTLTATISGFGIFSNNDSPVLVALVSIPHSSGFRTGLVTALKNAGIDPPEDHGWIPHITLAYGVDPTMPLPEIPRSIRGPFELDWLYAEIGDESTWYPLVDPAVAHPTLSSVAKMPT